MSVVPLTRAAGKSGEREEDLEAGKHKRAYNSRVLRSRRAAKGLVLLLAGLVKLDAGDYSSGRGSTRERSAHADDEEDNRG